jgi:polar amino acid transport system substrate-binding protein
VVAVLLALLAGTGALVWVADRGIRHEALPSMLEALAQVERGQADAVVYDAPILRWHIAEAYPGRLQVLPQVLERQDYGIALPQGSPRRESINTRLLEIIRGEDWQPLLSGYLGQAG